MSDQISNENKLSPLQMLKGTTTRRSLLRNSVMGATAVASATLLVTQTAGAATKSALHLSAEEAFEEIMRDENAHVAFLKSALGSYARHKPTFKGLEQEDTEHFIKLAQVFENVGVGAYLLAAPVIMNKGYLAAAGSILTIEARHAGYLDALVGSPLSPNGAFDKPIAFNTIVADVLPFIKDLNGPAPSVGSDAEILNFALLLEYLEASFYDINVPKFYR